MTMNFYEGITLNVNGKKVRLDGDTIKELHRQENIQWGKDISENYLPEDIFDSLSDDDFEKIAITLNEKMMENNGETEIAAIEEALGFKL